MEEYLLKQMKRTCGGRTRPQAMGRYIMRTGSTGLGSIRFTSPRITGHRHRSDRSSAAELFRNIPSPLQQSLCGVGVSGSLPVRNDAHVINPASGVTQSIGDDDEEEPLLLLPGRPGKPGSGSAGLEHGGCKPGDDEPGMGGGDGLAPGRPGKPAIGGDGLAPGKPGLRCLVPGNGKPGNRSNGDATARFLAASDDCSSSSIVTITATMTTARLDIMDDASIFLPSITCN